MDHTVLKWPGTTPVADWELPGAWPPTPAVPMLALAWPENVAEQFVKMGELVSEVVEAASPGRQAGR